MCIYRTLIYDRYVIIEHCEYEELFPRRCSKACLFILGGWGGWGENGTVLHTIHKNPLPSGTKISRWKAKRYKF